MDIGKLPSNLVKLQTLEKLDISHNNLSGDLPPALFVRSLQFFIANDNHFSGSLPHFWSDMKNLVVMNVAKNHLSGEISSSVASMVSLESLHLNSNNFSGELPSFLRSCKNLLVLDLGENRFHGQIPAWMGESFSLLKILRLRSNMFNGSIPQQFSQLVSLQLLDLANNNLSGSIPPSFGNLHSMTVKNPGMYSIGAPFGYVETISVNWQGREFEFEKTLSLVVGIDLSSNYLTLEIPEELTSLSGLVFLNLSRNQLNGNIPKSFGSLNWLESLDLSYNHLSGSIPPSFSSLMFLSYLNLSNNNLSGRIPSGYQLQTLNDASIYSGNYDLCGAPLSKNCSTDDDGRDGGRYGANHDEGNMEMIELSLSLGLGFVIGSWGFWGIFPNYLCNTLNFFI